MDWHCPHFTALIEAGGRISIAQTEPLQAVAMATRGRRALAFLHQRPGESIKGLMERLEAALEAGHLIDEVDSAMLAAHRAAAGRRGPE